MIVQLIFGRNSNLNGMNAVVPHVPGTVSGFIHAGEEYWDIPLSRTVRKYYMKPIIFQSDF